MYCEHCRQYVADGTAICPYCNTPIPQVGEAQPQANYFNQPQPQPQPQYQYQNSQQQVYQAMQGYPPPQPNPYAQYSNYESELSTSRTMGIVALIAAFFIPLVAWICGGIGLSKANSVPDLPQFAAEKSKCKKMNIWGIIIPFILGVIGILFYVIVIVAFMGVTSYY